MVKHFIPNTLKETLELLDKNQLEIIAGGTDLMVQRRAWANTSPHFKNTINIINLNELKYIKEDNGVLQIGSTTSLTDVLQSEFTPEILKKAIEEIASPALRNIATIAGNIGNASPAGDTIPILYLLDAEVVITSLNNERVIPVENVILGPRKTILQPNEIITEIRIPDSTFTNIKFVKVGGRKADAISKLSFTAASFVENDMVKDIRFAFGAVGPTIIRDRNIEAQLQMKSKEEIIKVLPKILEEYSELITPIDDQRSNKKYRKHVALRLLKDYILSI